MAALIQVRGTDKEGFLLETEASIHPIFHQNITIWLFNKIGFPRSKQKAGFGRYCFLLSALRGPLQGECSQEAIK